jgi:hypothetical protein
MLPGFILDVAPILAPRDLGAEEFRVELFRLKTIPRSTVTALPVIALITTLGLAKSRMPA